MINSDTNTKSNDRKINLRGGIAILVLIILGIFFALAAGPSLEAVQLAAPSLAALPRPTPPDQPLSAQGSAEFVQLLTDETENALDDHLDLDGVNSTKASIVSKFNGRGALTGKSPKQIADLLFADVKTVVTDKEVLDSIWANFLAVVNGDEAAQTQVTGRNVTEVRVAGSGTLMKPYVWRQVGGSSWQQVSDQGVASRTCTENARDDTSVNLDCDTTIITLDIAGKKINIKDKKYGSALSIVIESSSAGAASAQALPTPRPEPVAFTTPQSTPQPAPQPVPQPAPVNNNVTVRQYLDTLNYNEAQLLAEPTGDGEVVPAPKGKLPNKIGTGAVIVCTEVRNSDNAEYSKISILSPTGSTIFPGALIYANQDLRRGTPRGLKRFNRAPITITHDLPGTSTRIVLTDSDNLYTEYQEKLNAELEKWNSRNQQLPVDLRYTNGARAKYHSATAYSRKQIGIGLKVDVRWASGDASLDVVFANDAEKNDVVARFEQIFYTLTYQAPNAPEKVFDPGVTVDELRREANFDGANSPAYVSSVSYGRTIFLRMSVSSNVTNVDAKAAFEYGQQQATGIKVQANAKYDEILRSSELTAVVIGGNAENALNIIGPATTDNIRSVITGRNAIYSRNNPGVPISYTVNFLKDDKLASIRSSTEYNSIDCQTLNNFKLRVRQLDGAYVADTTLAYRDEACMVGGAFQEFRLTKPVNDALIPGAGATIATFSPFNGDRRNICFFQTQAMGVGWAQDYEIPGTATDIRLYLAAHYAAYDFRSLDKGNVILTPADFKLSTNPSGDNVPLCIDMRGTTISRFAEKAPCK